MDRETELITPIETQPGSSVDGGRLTEKLWPRPRRLRTSASPA